MRDLRAGLVLAGMLLTVAGIRSAAAQEPDGQALYRENCKSCHGINGIPPERERTKYKKLRALGDSGFVSSLTQDSIVTILIKGIDKDMKSFKDKMTEPEIRAVATYVKELAEKKKGG